MDKIPSFTIDHLRLKRGIFVSRQDVVGNEIITTFDVRMKEPNKEPALQQGALHTIEHLAATFLRNHKEWKDKITVAESEANGVLLYDFSANLDGRQYALYTIGFGDYDKGEQFGYFLKNGNNIPSIII